MKIWIVFYYYRGSRCPRFHEVATSPEDALAIKRKFDNMYAFGVIVEAKIVRI